METFTTDKAKLQELANEFAKGLKTRHDLNDFTKMLTKLAVETAQNAKLTEHLGYEKHQNSPEGAAKYASNRVILIRGTLDSNLVSKKGKWTHRSGPVDLNS